MRCTPATRQSNRNSLSEIAHLRQIARHSRRRAEASEHVLLYRVGLSTAASRSQSVQNENTFYSAPTQSRSRSRSGAPGNMGRAAIRAVDAHPGAHASAAGADRAAPTKVGRDAGRGGRARPRPRRGPDHRRGRRGSATLRAGRGGGLHGLRRRPARRGRRRRTPRAARRARSWSTPAVYALYDQRNAPAELRDPLLGRGPGGRRRAVRAAASTRAGATTCCRCW